MTLTPHFSRGLLAALLLASGAPTPAQAAGGSGSGGGSGGGAVALTTTSSGTLDVDMPGEILVKLLRSESLGPLLASCPVTLISRFGARPIYRLKVVGNLRVKDVLARLVLDPEVMIAETNPSQRSPEARKNVPWAIGTASEQRCANSNGAVLVAGAGNDASKSEKQYPAAEGAYGLLLVGASNAARALAGFSNFGSWIDLVAPGEGITSAVPGGYGTWSGTSMASPLAAGTAALLRSMDLRMAPTDVVKRLKRTTAVLCGTALRQVDAGAAVNNRIPPSSNCR